MRWASLYLMVALVATAGACSSDRSSGSGHVGESGYAGTEQASGGGAGRQAEGSGGRGEAAGGIAGATAGADGVGGEARGIGGSTGGTGGSDGIGGATAGAGGVGGEPGGTGGSTGGTGGVTGSTGGIGGSTGGTGGVTGGTGGTGGSTGGTGGATGGTGGSPTEAFLELDPTSMNFESIVLGTTAVATFTLTNRGLSTSGIPSISIESDSVQPGTPVTVSGCSAALPASASCELTISVTPPELGLLQGFVRITADPGTEHSGLSRLSIHVVGEAIGFEISSPSDLELGDVPPGVPVEYSITVTALVDLSDLTIGTAGDEVSVDASATTCTETLGEGASCVVAVQFLAPDVGWKSGGVGIRAGGSYGQMEAMDITANVTNASDLAVDPQTPEPFVAYFEETTAPVVFTVTNVSDTTLGTITSVLAGDDAGDFAISDTDCTVLAPDETCTVSVVCSPAMSASAATRQAILSVTDGNTHLAVPLSANVSF